MDAPDRAIGGGSGHAGGVPALYLQTFMGSGCDESMNVLAGELEVVVSTLRACFRGARVPEPVVEAGADPSPDHVAAAVLVPLVVREGSISVLFTRRSEHLHHHPGQICFPGGRIEASDASPTMAAIRETEEEVGLGADRLEVLGRLPEYFSRTGFRVTPVVALVHPPFELTLDSFEVAESFEVPFGFLMDESNHVQIETEHQGRPRRVYAMPYGDRNIWGTTAAILVSLHRFLRQE
jgi:8-oxo-dGTP pyrophosphatase MutT (NUDIX family)